MIFSGMAIFCISETRYYPFDTTLGERIGKNFHLQALLSRLNSGQSRQKYKNTIYFNALKFGLGFAPPSHEGTILGETMSQKLKRNGMSAASVLTEVPDIGSYLLADWRNASVANLGEAKMLLEQAEQLIATQRQRIAQLENLAVTDELTGLTNRRGLMSALRRELAAATRSESANGVLIMCDLNGFKRINDTHGHNAGDAYLRAVATALQAEVRPTDVVARIGGDEFAVLLTRVDGDNGFSRLIKLEQSFHTRALTWGARVLPLSASFGATSYGKDDTPEALLAAADLRLYAQKMRKHGI
jgi:diguanylate cyclase (GGDEF)-like protein